ncbi:MAG TPA: response regulator [Ktedonosporobacter sp.]|nr:response regulator [Ktedonosporobacter sp.]
MSNQPDSDKKTIVVVEDDRSIAEVFEVVISSETPYQAFLVEDDIEAQQRIEEIKAVKPVLFILDYQLSTMAAPDLYDYFQKFAELDHTPALILTAYSPHLIEDELARRGLFLLPKPFEVETLINTIEQIILSTPSPELSA